MNSNENVNRAQMPGSLAWALWTIFGSIFLYLLSNLTRHIDTPTTGVESTAWILTTILAFALHIAFIVGMLRRLRWFYVAYLVLAVVSLVMIFFEGREFNPKHLVLDVYLTGAGDVVDLVILILLLQKPTRTWFFNPRPVQATRASAS